jgi:hypothetical protein
MRISWASLERHLIGEFVDRLNIEPIDYRFNVYERDLLSSIWQKSIRRGNTQHALSAAAALDALDPSYIWRRARIIALEDIGLANPMLVAVILAISGKQVLRKRLGPQACVATVTRMMCESAKNRTACDLVSLANATTEFEPYRDALGHAHLDDLVIIANDVDSNPWERMAAVNQIVGYTVRVSTRYPISISGNAVARHAWLSSRNTSDLMRYIVNRGHDTYGLNGSLLLASDILTAAQTTIDANSTSRSYESIGDIPSYAFCMYTQVGRRAATAWLASDSVLQRAIASSGCRHAVKALGYIVFQIEGALLSPWLRSEESESLRRQADEAELDHLGIERQKQLQLLQLVAQRMPMLNRCRAKVAAEMGVV